MQAAEANATNKHIEEISLCGVFLLEAAKKADSAFGVPPPSSQHTVRDAQTDIRAMTQDLLQRAGVEEPDHQGPQFPDPTNKGMEERASKGWIESILHKATMYDEESMQC